MPTITEKGETRLKFAFSIEEMELAEVDGIIRARPLHGQLFGPEEPPKDVVTCFKTALAWFAAKGVTPSPRK